MNRTDVLSIVAAPLIRERRPVRLSRINAALAAAGQAETTVEELEALAGTVMARKGGGSRKRVARCKALA
ncbi:hypothetical protein [Azospirillum brasilense]|uniref:hypothetical protein n=1 Tax=Azospirillum brasilense TaxID=192 RepID=UPI001EDA268F|nr:hypothetical protein [Azospirillum brasilense]UKJ74495.1 hypothetical protein H1Q64_18210 [Azospirillum brasilense]